MARNKGKELVTVIFVMVYQEALGSCTVSSPFTVFS